MITKIKRFLQNKKDSLISNSENSLNKINQDWSDFKKKDTYLIHEEKKKIKDCIAKGKCGVKIPWYLYFNFKLKKQINNNLFNLNLYEQEIEEFNPIFVERKIKEYDFLFKKSPNPLDKNQKIAVITDDKHNLIVAGAGSGKTEVLITRIAYLIKRKNDSIEPKRILALAFQNKAAKEIEERLNERYGIDVEVKTFHSLGKKILETSSKMSGKKPQNLMFDGDNVENKFSLFIKNIFNNLIKEREFQKKVFEYLEDYDEDFIDKDENDFETKEEFYNYKKSLQYTALNGVKLKSKDEKEILNFFITNSLNNKPFNIIYESPADWMKYTNEEGQEIIPKPDFFFPEFNIYLEHWAIDEEGNVPKWFEGKNPTEEYIKNMNLKKEKFKKNKIYSLIETSHADFKKDNFKDVLKGRFERKMKAKYPSEDFAIKELSYNELVEKVWEECKMSLKTLPNRISDFITIAKTYNLDSKKILKRLKEERWSQKQMSFTNIALIVFDVYEKELKKENKIDFGDMINLAIEELKENRDLYRNTYDHVLVDEYQDLSHQRYELIHALMNKNKNCKLFCVGDDWQGIMGFSGANLNFFVNFQDYFNYPARTDLSYNYRSVKSIVDTGAEIIKNNKNSQLQKKTLSKDIRIEPIEIYASNIKKEKYMDYNKEIANHCITKILEYKEKGYDWKDMMILMRIRNPNILLFIDKFAREKNIPVSSENIRPTNSIPIMSVHSSKGLQAKIVFILNLNKDLYGFPCELENPDVYEPAKLNDKKDREEEERRLFYVAVTRAREKVVIYTQKCSSSKFLDEIKEHVKWKDI